MNNLEEAKAFIAEKGFYLMQEEDINRFAECATDTFMGYPLYDYILGKVYPRKKLFRLLKAELLTYWKESLIFADSKECKGWAMLFPTSKDAKSSTFSFLLKNWRYLFALSPISLYRMYRYTSFARLKDNFEEENAWQCFSLTVRPQYQRGSIGLKLALAIAAMFDKQQTNAFLRTHSTRIMKAYADYGFKIIKQEFIPNTKIMHYAMIRTPEKSK